MEAKKRLIDELRIHSILADEREKPDRSIVRAMKQLRKEQDEISLKAGIKEVVEFVEAHTHNIEEWTGWQEQKEEWGIE